MSVSILNTDAGLSGKTVVIAESAQTITGLHTFDRDPNAPFAVAAGSAVVTNLDADKLDGKEGNTYVHKTDDMVWTTWSPTLTNLTIGNGTVVARYSQVGKIVHFRLQIVLGNTSSIGGVVAVSLPATADTTVGVLGAGELIDASASGTLCVGRFASTTTMNIIGEAGAAVTTTAPFVWTTNDQIRLAGTYEAA